MDAAEKLSADLHGWRHLAVTSFAAPIPMLFEATNHRKNKLRAKL